VLAQVGRHEFDPKGFAVIDGEPIVYWWSKEFLERYAAAPKLGEVAPVRLNADVKQCKARSVADGGEGPSAPFVRRASGLGDVGSVYQGGRGPVLV
jgi:hypothetical protein